ncbi:MAG: PadR family transcriptional regulator [Hydrogenibacillus schlegelii]|uniref:PadR family transcriptional regulator n=1 Tax=Hydrogenibacillus schlegelii TaxID=1484 RepID=A0A947CWG8_HYDSH|nr:PadR family transcriptional regulator [Hydrogenibacillus schlegelii]
MASSGTVPSGRGKRRPFGEDGDYTQLFKGVLEGVILALLAEEEAYGYAVSEKLRAYGFPAVSDGSIYPLLLRLENRGGFRGELRENPGKRAPRKYYRLTPEGRTAVDDFRARWRTLVAAVNAVLKGGEPPPQRLCAEEAEAKRGGPSRRP